MALHEPPSSSSSRNEIETELRQLSDMESELEKLVEKVIYCRENVADEVKNKFSSLLSTQRPLLPTIGTHSESGLHSGTRVEANTLLEDQEASKKINLLKQKIANNKSTRPIVLKRMNDCISRFDKLGSYNMTVHPVFKKKRTSSPTS